MPGNIIKINDSKDHGWYVGDSKMDLLIAFLNEIGTRQTKEPERCSNCEGFDASKSIKVTKEDVFKCPECGKPIICTQDFVTVKET